MKITASIITAMTVLCLASSAQAQKLAAKQEFQPEEYSQEGQTNGCGVTVTAVWPTDEGEVLGVTASINFIFVPEHKNVMALLKANAFLDGKRVPVSYAWFETTGYGRTTDFSKGASEDPNAFIGAKNSNSKALLLVGDVANFGSVLGITIKGRSVDEAVKLPPAPKDVSSKVEACFSRLEDRMKASMK